MTNFVIKIPRAIGLGITKCSIFTKPFSRTQTNSFSMVYLHDNLYLYDCIYEDYVIYSSVYDRTTQTNMILAIFIISNSFGEMGQLGLMSLGPA